MSDLRDRLAREIREALGDRDDTTQPIVVLVRGLVDRIAELEAELKECRRTALGDGYERANIEHAGHFAELEAENARLRELLTLIRDDLRLRADGGVVDISNFIWERINAALLGGGE